MGSQVIFKSGAHFKRSLANVALEFLGRIARGFRFRCWLLLLRWLLWMVLRVINEHLRVSKDFVASVTLVALLFACVSALVELQRFLVHVESTTNFTLFSFRVLLKVLLELFILSVLFVCQAQSQFFLVRFSFIVVFMESQVVVVEVLFSYKLHFANGTLELALAAVGR